jgi:hypothetical protein
VWQREQRNRSPVSGTAPRRERTEQRPKVEFSVVLVLCCGNPKEKRDMTPLRAAASALLEAAPETTVLTILRLLIDSVAPAPARARVDPPLPPADRPAPAKRQPAAATPSAPDPAWETLRSAVKTAMTERGASYAAIADMVGRSEIGMRITIGSRKPPKLIIRARLQAWLEQAEQAPAVAAPLLFHRSGTEHRSNGHDHHAGAHSTYA